MNPTLRHYIGFFVRRRMKRAADAFHVAAQSPRETQTRVLHELLRLNAGSAFAGEHRFDEIRTVADFRRHIPVSDYEYFRPYIERVKQGEQRALLGPDNRLLMFALTSGTTADSKFIPITERFLEDYRRGWQTWGISNYLDHPALFLQEMVQLSSDDDQFRTPGGHPCGNISGLVRAIQNPIVTSMYTTPHVVSKIKSPEAKYYTALRLSLPNRIVGMAMTANPSTLIHLAKLADAHREELIRDIAEGTLSERFEVSREVRSALGRKITRPDRMRARELERVVERTGHLFPKDCWPGMTMLAVWTGGSAGAYLPGLQPFYGNLPVRDHGLSASEGRMTIPFRDNRPDGVLDVETHYFEFIPEEEHDRPNPTVLESHELEEGRNYYILLTTSSGLCRYDIRDVVRCTGFHGKTPTLEFLNKGSHISSITGEKISESQVVTAVREAVVELKLTLSHYTLTPVWGDPPGYRLLLESSDLPSPHFAEKLAAAADARLQKLNIEYGEKRQTGRLVPMAPVPLPAGTWQRFLRKRQSKLGGSVEQYKHPCLVPDLKFHDGFLSEFVEPFRQQSAG